MTKNLTILIKGAVNLTAKICDTYSTNQMYFTVKNT